eukprot:6212856-Pleurochrysis_carterae.AAC.3
MECRARSEQIPLWAKKCRRLYSIDLFVVLSSRCRQMATPVVSTLQVGRTASVEGGENSLGQGNLGSYVREIPTAFTLCSTSKSRVSADRNAHYVGWPAHLHCCTYVNESSAFRLACT